MTKKIRKPKIDDEHPVPKRIVEQHLSKIEEQFQNGWHFLANNARDIAVNHGFWANITENSVGTKIALMHSELSELLEAYRHGDNYSKIIDATQVEEEIADLVIRIMDFSRYHNLNIPKAINLKMQYNKSRQYKHNKAF